MQPTDTFALQLLIHSSNTFGVYHDDSIVYCHGLQLLHHRDQLSQWAPHATHLSERCTNTGMQAASMLVSGADLASHVCLQVLLCLLIRC